MQALHKHRSFQLWGIYRTSFWGLPNRLRDWPTAVLGWGFSQLSAKFFRGVFETEKRGHFAQAGAIS